MKKKISPITSPPMNNKDDLNPFDNAVDTDAKTPGPGVTDRIIIPIKNANNISKFINFPLGLT
jgi:hypothetical protein